MGRGRSFQNCKCRLGHQYEYSVSESTDSDTHACIVYDQINAKLIFLVIFIAKKNALTASNALRFVCQNEKPIS